MAIDRDGVGKRAREERKKHDWSLRQIEGWSGIHRGTLSKIERGQQVPGDEMVALLAKGLRVTEAWLLGIEA